ncbi:glycosyltransferase family 2 protein [Powellomyces hirtus]|nr:glycosyltransferase family 2 protein [Powellomyces hirtus]
MVAGKDRPLPGAALRYQQGSLRSQSQEALLQAGRPSAEYSRPTVPAAPRLPAPAPPTGPQQRPPRSSPLAPRTRLSIAFPQKASAANSNKDELPTKSPQDALGAPPLHPVSMRQQVGPAGNVSRKKSMVRHDRSLNRRPSSNRRASMSGLGRSDTLRRRQPGAAQRLTWWRGVVNTLTVCLPAPLLSFFNMKDHGLQIAFKEKIALCILIFLCMAFVGFITFFFNTLACSESGVSPINYKTLNSSSYFAVRGAAYDLDEVLKIPIKKHALLPGVMIDYPQMKGQDLSALFPVVTSKCFEMQLTLPCTVPGVWPPNSTRNYDTKPSCHSTYNGKPQNIIGDYTPATSLFLDFDEVKDSPNRLIFNGNVWDISRMGEIQASLDKVDPRAYQLIMDNRGRDATKAFTSSDKMHNAAKCLDQVFRIAKVDSTSIGCAVSNVLVYISFAVIIGTVGARFLLAVIFQWTIGWRLGARDKGSRVAEDLKRRRHEQSTMSRQPRPSLNAPSAAESKTAHDAIELNEIAEEGSPKKPAAVRASGLMVRNPSGEAEGKSNTSAGAEVKSVIPNQAVTLTSSEHKRSASTRSSKAINPDSALVRGPNGVMMRPTLPTVELPEMDLSLSNTFRDLEQSAPYTKTDPTLNDPTLMHTLVMVPCYSEGYESLRATLDSVARAYYPSTHKTIFVIADGIVQGSGNDKTTSDYLIDMMEIDERFKEDDPKLGGEPQAYSYVAIADGSKRKNYARVYAGWYRYAITDEKAKKDAGSAKDISSSMYRTLTKRKRGKVPMILVVKCGNEEERHPETGAAKPGNRGKRDSQLLLMHFLSKVMFDDRMTELEFEIFHKLWSINGLHPEMYETVMMVDADTRLYPDSMTHLLACMKRDPQVMGVCGETKVYNKWDSWVTMIQVYEYYISHHLSKAFESVFGGVTCLPGCFSAYRIKAPKNGQWVPILANPDIVEEYSENVVETLHTKNLLLLGEDRFLTTLMLKAFPKRRNVFVPQAICKTVVPDTFSVLLSQRRRWINSTIHNLLELVLVRDLCGTFCFSMQFVIFMELIGSIVLPAACVFTVYLIVQAGIGHLQLIPLIMLAAILGLPALLILLTVRRIVYFFWFVIYLLALPIWQFILPLYAFWHFDDFTWGDTRIVSGEEGKKAEDHSKRDGEFDYNGINMKRWQEWVRERATLLEVKRRTAVAAKQAKQGKAPRPGPGPFVPSPFSGPGYHPSHASFLPPVSGPMVPPGAFSNPSRGAGRGMMPPGMFRAPPGAIATNMWTPGSPYGHHSPIRAPGSPGSGHSHSPGASPTYRGYFPPQSRPIPSGSVSSPSHSTSTSTLVASEPQAEKESKET